MKSTAFSDQDWPGKKAEKKGGGEGRDEDKDDVEDDGARPDDKPEMSPEDKRLFDMLVQEEETQRAFGNNDGKPEGNFTASTVGLTSKVLGDLVKNVT